jgi:hypothetical protein
MNFKPYDKKIEPRCPVAVKLNQTTVHAPAHDTWGTLTCDGCADSFFIGTNRIYGARISAEETAKRLEKLLAEDHKQNRPHADSYEIPD